MTDLERIRLNAIIHGQRENLRELNEIRDILKKEIAHLQEKLEIAKKALNGIRDVWANNPSQFSFVARIANRKAKTALEEMEGVK